MGRLEQNQDIFDMGVFQNEIQSVDFESQ